MRCVYEQLSAKPVLKAVVLVVLVVAGVVLAERVFAAIDMIGTQGEVFGPYV